MLRNILDRMDNPVQPVFSSRWFMPATWCIFVVLVAAVYVIGEHVSHWLAAFGFILLGTGYMHAYFKAAAARGWPVLTRYFNRDRIESRLAELES
jgi:hypothetical protein